jgi:hypothetical protein
MPLFAQLEEEDGFADGIPMVLIDFGTMFDGFDIIPNGYIKTEMGIA